MSDDHYHEKMDHLKNEFASALDKYTEVYVRYKMNPGPSYTELYEKAKGRLNSVESQLKSIRLEAESSTEDLADRIRHADRKIKQLTEENDKLKARNDVLVGAKNASIGQMQSYRDDYRNNVFTLLTLLATSTMVVKMML